MSPDIDDPSRGPLEFYTSCP